MLEIADTKLIQLIIGDKKLLLEIIIAEQILPVIKNKRLLLKIVDAKSQLSAEDRKPLLVVDRIPISANTLLTKVDYRLPSKIADKKLLTTRNKKPVPKIANKTLLIKAINEALILAKTSIYT